MQQLNMVYVWVLFPQEYFSFKTCVLITACYKRDWAGIQIIAAYKRFFSKQTTVDFYTYFCFAMGILKWQKDSRLCSPAPLKAIEFSGFVQCRTIVQ